MLLKKSRKTFQRKFDRLLSRTIRKKSMVVNVESYELGALQKRMSRKFAKWNSDNRVLLFHPNPQSQKHIS